MSKIKSGYYNLTPPTPIRENVIERVYSLVGGDIVPNGENNLYPNEMAAMLRQSKYQRGILKSKRSHFVGTDFFSEDAKTQKWLDEPNEEYSLHEAFNRLMMDYGNDGNGYLKIVTNREKSFFKIYHLDGTKCRLNKDHEIVFNHDWINRTKEDDEIIPPFPEFKKDGKYFISAIHIKDYEPEFAWYGVAGWIGGFLNVKIDIQTDEWNQHHVEHGYKTDNVIVFPDGVSDAEIKEVKKSHKEFKEGKPGGFFYLVGDGVKVSPQNSKVLDVDWEKLNRLNIDKMVMANSWFKSLLSISQNTGFDTERVKYDYQLAKVEIAAVQNKFRKIFNEIFNFFGYDSNLQIENIQVLPEPTPIEKLVLMKDFLTDEQKTEIGADIFDEWKSTK